jgi:glycosyltransferase involved in cell wall biosynthesis
VKILQVHVYGSLGGIENATRDVLDELERRGHSNVLVHGGERLDGLERPGRVSVYWPHAQDFGLASEGLVGALKTVVEREEPDVALVHTPLDGPLVSCISDRLPAAYFAHNYGAFCASGAQVYLRDDSECGLTGVPDARCLANAYLQKCNTRRPLKLLELYRRTKVFGSWARHAEAVLCGSEFVASKLRANGFRSERLHVVYYPVAVVDDATAERSRPATDDYDIFFAGRVSPEKGLDYLLRALARLSRPWKLAVAGSGGELPAMQTLASRLGLGERVVFLGSLSRDRLASAYAGAKVAVVPSVWPEPFGMVGPEAMSMGTPVVAFASGGIPEWLDDGEVGYLVPSRDVDQLALRLDELLSNSELATRLGARGREVVAERFSVGRHVDRVLAALESAYQVRRGAPAAESLGLRTA